MEPQSLQTVVVDERDDVYLVSVAGDVDLASEGPILDMFRNLPTNDKPVVLELSGVTFLDSTGLRSLLEVRGMAQASGRDFSVLRPSGCVLRLLDLTQTRDLLPIVDDPE